MKKIPTHDPYTGELNPYYEELTGEKNPLSIKSSPMIELMNILLSSSRLVPNDQQYGYLVRRLLEEAKDHQGDWSTLSKIAKNIIKDLKNKSI